MPVTLTIYIVRAPATAAYTKYLQVEDVGATLVRNVSLIKIPGDIDLALDLGMSAWEISLAGVADNSMTLQASGSVANFADLADMRTWGTSNVVRLYLETSTYADGKIKGITTRRVAGTNYWTFNLEFVVETLTFPPP